MSHNQSLLLGIYGVLVFGHQLIFLFLYMYVLINCMNFILLKSMEFISVAKGDWRPLVG